MKRTTIVVVCVVVLVVVGIFGFTHRPSLRFADVALNKDLPKDYKTRVMWPQTDALKYDIAQLAGHVVVGNRATGEFERGRRYLKAGFEPKVQIIDGGTIYNSKVDRSASTKGEYLGFAGSLDGKQTAEVTITDASSVIVPWEQIPTDDLAREASKEVSEGKERFYVQAVVLATVTIRNYAEVSGDVAAIKGAAFGANGKVYSETGDVSKDFQISVTLLSLREMALPNFSETNLESLIIPATFAVRSVK